jgi:hypothetical protein
VEETLLGPPGGGPAGSDRVPLLEQKEGEYQGMDKATLSTYDLRNKIFDNIILLMILVSSAMLPLDSPMNNPDSP